jgi:hypothetical protein
MTPLVIVAIALSCIAAISITVVGLVLVIPTLIKKAVHSSFHNSVSSKDSIQDGENTDTPQSADVRVKNSCAYPLWIEARQGALGQPLPGQTTSRRKVEAGAFIDYDIPAGGLAGARFWPKYGCDSTGKNCEIGDSSQYMPEGGCPNGGCSVAADSLFEATFGCKPGVSPCTTNPSSGQPLSSTTYYDSSLVDGVSLPFKVTLVGDTSTCNCDGAGNCLGEVNIDGTAFNPKLMPSTENLSMGQYNSYTNPNNGQTYNLTSVDLRLKNKAGTHFIGAISPCKKLNYPPPTGFGMSESEEPTLFMCCPTPLSFSNCTPENGCVTPSACRAGPIVNTQYVAAIHEMVPNSYAFSYDDAVGLFSCPSDKVKYQFELCPSGSITYPQPV